MTNPPRPPRIPWDLAALIAANLVPFFGVLVLQWDLGIILVLFWLENGIIGAFNVVKMLIVGRLHAVPLAAFFCFHYGFFMLVHFLFIYNLFLDPHPLAPRSESPPLATLATIAIIPALILVASHGVSFMLNFIHQGEHKRTSLISLMAAPYARIFVVGITIIAGGFLFLLAGSPRPALAVLVAAKIIADVASHRVTHAKRATRGIPIPNFTDQA